MQDMTADEGSVMQAHATYWRGKLAEGHVIAFGPVADPAGGWGVGIVAVPDEAELRLPERRPRDQITDWAALRGAAHAHSRVLRASPGEW